MASKTAHKEPGPGMYDIDHSYMGKSYSFGNDKRKEMGKSKLNVPGPGQYMLPGTVSVPKSYERSQY